MSVRNTESIPHSGAAHVHEKVDSERQTSTLTDTLEKRVLLNVILLFMLVPRQEVK